MLSHDLTADGVPTWAGGPAQGVNNALQPSLTGYITYDGLGEVYRWPDLYCVEIECKLNQSNRRVVSN